MSLPCPIRSPIGQRFWNSRWAGHGNEVRWRFGRSSKGSRRKKEGGKIHLRPTILSSLLGVGRFDGWILEVSQRIDDDGSVLILKTPLVRRRSPNNPAKEWEAE